MNTTLMLIFELLGGVILLFAAGYALARVIGSDEYYDNIFFDSDEENSINNDNDDQDFIHHASI